MHTEIFGVKITLKKEKEILDELNKFLAKKDGRGYTIVTPNPEFLLLARKNTQFKDILNKADLAIADGTGIWYAAWYLRKPLPEIIHGVDLMEKLFSIAQKQERKVFCVLARGSLSSLTEIKNSLKEKFPRLQFECGETFSQHKMIGQIKFQQENVKDDECLIQKINYFRPDIVFVGLGQMCQEEWILFNRPRLLGVTIFMGIGGAFDFFTGKQKRAPIIVRALGFEWFWRLCKQPKRFFRIWNAFIVFIWLIVWSRFLRYNKNSN